MTGGAEKNLIENNVFNHLRHSIVLQNNAYRNVIGYNSSIDAVGMFRGDMILHCGDKNGNETGPMLNLMEGNIVERALVDDKDGGNYHNGPYNTYFRNRAIYSFYMSHVDSDYKEQQYGQNVVGCNMDPFWHLFYGSTLKKLDKYGFKKYYDNWSDWEDLPPNRKSYYKTSTPDFFSDGFDWPFVPARSNVTPARDRWNRHQSSGTSPAVFQSMANYDPDCAPLQSIFNGEVWNNTTDEYKAMDEIILDNCQIIEGNTLTFKAGSKVRLTNGTHIGAGNNVHISYGNGICDWSKKKEQDKSKDSTLLINNSMEQPSIRFLNERIKLFPNPNNGSFIVQTKPPINIEHIQLFDVLGNRLEFRYFNKSIQLLNSFTGLLFVIIRVKDEIVIKKIMIK
jgi:hypothetical protein